jgi:integrase
MMGVAVRQKVEGRDEPWWVFITHRGKRRSKCVGDKKAANELAKELRKALAAGDLGILQEPAANEGITFAVYAKQYLDRMEHELKRATLRDYEGITRRHLIPALGEKALTAITRADVKALANTLRAKGFKKANVKKHLTVLSSILSEAVDPDELISVNPVRELGKNRKRRSKEKAETNRKRIDPFTAEELAKLLDTARTHAVVRRGTTVYPYRKAVPFLLLLARTGLRLSEAIGLAWRHIDWHGNRIHVERAYVLGEFAAPKSGRERYVDMSDELKATLRAVYRERFETVVAIDAEAAAALEVERAVALDALVFPNSVGQPQDDHDIRSRMWAPLLLAAGLRRRRLHDVRHSYASLLLQQGAELLYVSEQLGHHAASFTLERYVHLMPRNRRGYVNRFDHLAPAGTPAAPATETAVSLHAPDIENPAVSQGLF